MRLHNRQIKATFWNDPDLLQMPRDKRLFYVGLSQLADDSGCLEDSPLAFKIHLFPSPIDSDITVELITQWVDELINQNKVVRYEVGSKKCLYLANFHKHQKLDRPSPPETPLPPWIQWKDYPGRNPGKYIIQDRNSGEIIKDDKREGDLEEEFAELISTGLITIDGQKAISFDRQVRLKGSYLDIVASTIKGNYFFELKECFLSGAALAQIVKYQRFIKESGKEESKAILIGRGIIPSFSYDIAKQNNITVYILKEDYSLKKLCGNTEIVVSRDFTKMKCENMLLVEPELEPELEPERELEPENNNGGIDNTEVDNKEAATDKNPMIEIQRALQKAGILMPSHYQIECLLKWHDDGMELDLIMLAIKKAAKANNPRVDYIEGTLRGWSSQKITTLAQAEAADQEFQQRKKSSLPRAPTGPPAQREKTDDELYMDSLIAEIPGGG